MSKEQNTTRKNRKKPSAFKGHGLEISVTLSAIGLIHLALLAKTYHGEFLDAENAGQFGDFIGGYFGTLVLVVSVGFIYASFRNQRRANERSIFENRFFELLKFHRENVSEIGIGSTKSGRRVFVSLIREFRECLEVVEHLCTNLNIPRTTDQKIDLAYLAFYYGVGPNSSRVLEKAIAHHPTALVSEVIKELERIQKDYRDSTKEIEDVLCDMHRRRSYENHRSTLTRLSYCPFDGHQSRLGHYYRHLFQLMKYVDLHAPGSWNTVCEYAGIVRAQLTNHEQALLCLNALSTIGSPWITKGILVDYAMIKNIPHDFFDPARELDLEDRFPTIDFEFRACTDAEPNRSHLVPDTSTF